VNETTTATVGLRSAEDVATSQLQHVGAAYGFVFLLLFAFAWRTTQATRRLAERVDELERERGGSR
jgi:hypothetical protein